MYTFLSVEAAMIFVSAELNESLRWDLFRSKHMLYKVCDNTFTGTHTNPLHLDRLWQLDTHQYIKGVFQRKPVVSIAERIFTTMRNRNTSFYFQKKIKKKKKKFVPFLMYSLFPSLGVGFKEFAKKMFPTSKRMQC